MKSSVHKKMGTSVWAATAVAVGALLWAVACAVFLAMPFTHSLVFIAFQLIAVALPGFAILKLFRLKTTPLESFVAAYGFGICALVVLYYIFAPLGLFRYMIYGVLLLAAVSIVVLILLRNRRLSAVSDTGEMKIAVVFCAAAAIFTFVTLSLATLTPDLTGGRFYHPDILYGVSMSTSLAHEYPMTVRQMAGIESSYYKFYYCYTALFSNFSKINSFEILTKMSCISTSVFLAASVIALAKRVLKDNRFVVVSSVLCLVIPPYYLANNIYQSTLGFPQALAFGVLSVLFYIIAEQIPAKIYNRYYAISSLFLVACVGSKSPLSVTVLFAICFSLLLTLIRTKRWNVFVQGLLYAIPFFVVYRFVHGASINASIGISPFSAAIRTPFAYMIDTLPDFLYKPLAALYYVVSLDPLLSLFLIVMFIYMVRTKEGSQPIVDLAIGGILFSMIMINIFRQSGSSETYFFLAIETFGYIAGLYCVRRLFFVDKKHVKKIGPVLVSLIAIPCIVLNAVMTYRCHEGRIGVIRTGVAAAVAFPLHGNPPTYEQLRSYEREVYMTVDDYDAYIWVRDNTPLDAVVIDGRHTYGRSRYMCGSVFSERAFFLDGYFYIQIIDEREWRETLVWYFYGGQDESFLPMLANEGVNYVIISQIETPGFYPSDKYCSLVYANDTVSVYEVTVSG